MKMNHAYLLVSLLLGLSGCTSIQNQTVLDGVQEAGLSQPFIELYIEYAGPHEKWAGPASFMLHVIAKDNQDAQIFVTPAMFGKVLPAPTMATDRAPASVSNKVASGASVQDAREQFNVLAMALNGPDVGFRGCLAPIRVRLIRADGSLFEKYGCRGSSSWSKAASSAVNNFLSVMGG